MKPVSRMIAEKHRGVNAMDENRQAVDTARRQGAKSWELRAAASLGRLWQQQGKRAAARELLAAVYGWFKGFDTADLRGAETLLSALS
jgi:predicted ATPase